MDILSSILFTLGILGAIIAFAMAIAAWRFDKKAFKISLLLATAFVIMGIIGYIIMPKYPSSNASNSEKCSICGREVFAGKLCEDCFNDWADGY